MEVILPSKMNFNLSEEEETYLDTYVKNSFLSFEISQIIKRLEYMDERPRPSDKETIGKIFEILNIPNEKERLPKYITRLKNSFICRRNLKGRRIIVKQSTDLNEVIRAHNKFCKEHNLKM